MASTPSKSDEHDQKTLESVFVDPILSVSDGLKEPQVEPEVSDITIPDGGWQAWLTVTGSFLLIFVTFGSSTSFGVFQNYYAQQNTSTSSNISWIGSVQLALFYFGGLPAGRLFDAGYFRHIQIGGSLLFCFSFFMLSLADTSNYYQLLLSQGVGMGLGGGLLLTPALSIPSHHFNKKLSLALGIAQVGSSAGGIIMPIMLNQLFNGRAGFAWGVRATAFLVLGLLAISCCIMKTRLPPAQHQSQISMKALVTDTPYAISLFGVFMVMWGLFFPYFYLQVWVTEHGLSSTLSFYTIPILNAGTIFGRIIPNFIADYVGVFNMFCPMALVSAALIFAMFGVMSPGAVIVFTILYGFFTGSCRIRIGLCLFVVAFAVLSGTPIDGALVGSEYVWYKALLFSGIIMLVGSALLTIARHLFAKRKGTVWT
ncbi:MFS general substrate transporter [Laetiporus sulphureus 93-53]|uniref:MFS general substrate transporter n=1 Tax=Laetiporus sulphureus 93-53 TaxID=1314785 RepID=A0A165CZ34_9APHY|nr:MFS general substrate transporter [Laetiporus sulphureus 93-53]KZT03786.1 MFS general substrate transporter [Laetiporus sulphureus 93-53]